MPHSDIRMISTGPVGPGHKRDIALKHAEGQVLAYLDDDTYPPQEWLKNAVKYFELPDVAAVGGPAVTAPADSFMQKASGNVFSSIAGSGNLAFRYVPQASREVDDFPTCNLLVRKDYMQIIGGFDTNYWPGEDTIACLRIARDLRKKIIYAPDAVVYHHRRKLFIPHLKQVWSYALHRGYFVKKFPETSRRLTYFVPTLFVVGLCVGVIAAVPSPLFRLVLIAAMSIYFLAILLDTLRFKSLAMVPVVVLGTFLTHVVYGAGFLKGLLSKKLREDVRLGASAGERAPAPNNN